MPFTGERMTDAIGGQVEIEHLHRYYLAREYCRDRDVLDIAAGEGYGSAILAQVARSVRGVEISPDAVAFATENFKRDNLVYVQGDARRIPLPDASIDVAVSFETLEHLYEHEAFLAELKRVLRPDGLLILSTPDRDHYSPTSQPVNEYHVRELTRAEFGTLLSANFAHYELYGQRPNLGSVIAAEGRDAAGAIASFERRNDDFVESSQGLARPLYWIAFASDGEVPRIAANIYVHSLDIDGPEQRRKALEVRLAGLTTDRDNALAAMQSAHAELARAQADLEATRAAKIAAESVVSDWSAQLAQTLDIVAQRDEELIGLTTDRDGARAAAQSAHAELARAQADLEATRAAKIAAESIVSDLSAQLAQRDEVLAATRAERAAVRDEAQRLAESLLNLEAQRTAERAEAETRLARMRETTTAQITTTLADAEARVATILADAETRLETALTDAQARVSSALVDADERIGAAQAEAEASVARADSEVRARTAQLERAQADVLALSAQIDAAQARLAALSRSTSWRITAPLRALSHVSNGRWDLVSQAVAARTHRLPPALRAPLLNLFAKAPSRIALPEPVAPPPPAPATAVWAGRVKLPTSQTPAVTVIIPIYGKVDYTLRCLESIMRYPPSTPFEVIVAEDASGDPEVDYLDAVQGLRFIRNPVNLGFLRCCNASALHARGQRIFLLNNDTEVTPGWLDESVALMDARPQAGLVGSKLVYPDGRLQEAGGIVWRDGSAWNYGRLGDPAASVFNYVRETDYCSAAAVLIDRALWDDLGGFDEHYMPAYCEDSDLAFRIRAAGRQVLYCPRSTVVHYEGVSHGSDTNVGIKAYQVTNQAKLHARWRQALERAHFANGTHVLRARERSHDRRVALVIDHYTPQPDRDAGSRTMRLFIDHLLDAGYAVKFWPDNQAYDPVYTPPLQWLGVEVIYGEPSLESWLAQNGAEIDLALVSRPDVAGASIPLLRKHTNAPIVYYGHDLHADRMALEAEITGRESLRADAERMRAVEMSAWRAADVTLYPTDEEAGRVRAMAPDVAARAIPAYAYDRFATERTQPPGATVLFVAGFGHPPNVDAALWLVDEIWPRIQAARPDARLALVGSNPTPQVRALAGPGVDVTGFVSDEELAARYAQATVALVPLRFGAGVKSKVVEALREGLPVVTTPVGAQGLPGLDDVAAVAETADALAAQVVRLLDDADDWRRASRDGAAYAKAHFSRDVARRVFLAAIEAAPIAPDAFGQARRMEADASPVS